MTDWEAVERLAARVGEEAGDLSSGHERWRIYQRAMGIAQARSDLLAALKVEPDRPVASAAAVQLLMCVPPESRNAVVAVIGEGKGRDFVALRSKELGILESLLAGEYEVNNVLEDLDSWSTWLQLRVASQVTDGRILAELARAGHTKRVRSTATERLRLHEPYGVRLCYRRRQIW